MVAERRSYRRARTIRVLRRERDALFLLVVEAIGSTRRRPCMGCLGADYIARARAATGADPETGRFPESAS